MRIYQMVEKLMSFQKNNDLIDIPQYSNVFLYKKFKDTHRLDLKIGFFVFQFPNEIKIQPNIYVTSSCGDLIDCSFNILFNGLNANKVEVFFNFKDLYDKFFIPEEYRKILIEDFYKLDKCKKLVLEAIDLLNIKKFNMKDYIRILKMSKII